MAFFDSLADYRPEGEALFSYMESPVARRYAHRIKPWGFAGIIVFGLMIFFCSGLLLFLEGANWAKLAQAFKSNSGSGYFFIFCLLASIVSYIFYKPQAHRHIFYDNVAKIYRGASKQPYRWILPRKIECMIIERTEFEKELFYLITVRFKWLKPKFLGKPSDVQFAISTEVEPANLIQWAIDREISTSLK